MVKIEHTQLMVNQPKVKVSLKIGAIIDLRRDLLKPLNKH
jgi:hypothetical protein